MLLARQKTGPKSKQMGRIKTPTNVLLYADTKEQAMRILLNQNKTLSGFIQEQIEELVKKSEGKKTIFIQAPSYENTLPLEPNQDPYDYDYKIQPVPAVNEDTSVTLSFSMRQKLKLD